MTAAARFHRILISKSREPSRKLTIVTLAFLIAYVHIIPLQYAQSIVAKLRYVGRPFLPISFAKTR